MATMNGQLEFRRIGTSEVVTAAVLASMTASFVPEMMKDDRVKLIAAAVIGTSIGSALGKQIAFKIIDYRKRK